MPLNFSYSLTLDISGGAKLGPLTGNISIDAYTSFQLELAAGQTRRVDVHVDPPQSIVLLAIACDQHDPNVTFSVPGAPFGPIPLDKPQVLMGAAVTLLGPPPPYLELKNGLNAPAVFRILVIRTVEPGIGGDGGGDGDGDGNGAADDDGGGDGDGAVDTNGDVVTAAGEGDSSAGDDASKDQSGGGYSGGGSF